MCLDALGGAAAEGLTLLGFDQAATPHSRIDGASCEGCRRVAGRSAHELLGGPSAIWASALTWILRLARASGPSMNGSLRPVLQHSMQWTRRDSLPFMCRANS